MSVRLFCFVVLFAAEDMQRLYSLLFLVIGFVVMNYVVFSI